MVNMIDDHSGLVEKTVGYWISNYGNVAVAINADCYSLNEKYTDEKGNLHISTRSIGPVAHKDEIAEGVIKTPTATWKLVRF